MLSLMLAMCSFSFAKDTAILPPLPHALPVDPPPGSNLLTANTYAGDAIASMLLVRMDSGGRILAASLADLDDLDVSSPVGRLSAQQIGSRIAQHGFRVMEARVTGALHMEKRAGEFMLSRDAAKLLAAEYNADAALVGCYSRTEDKLFISARVVRLSDNVVLGAYEYYVPLDNEARVLLGRESVLEEGTWGAHVARGRALFRAPGGK